MNEVRPERKPHHFSEMGRRPMRLNEGRSCNTDDSNLLHSAGWVSWLCCSRDAEARCGALMPIPLLPVVLALEVLEYEGAADRPAAV